MCCLGVLSRCAVYVCCLGVLSTCAVYVCCLRVLSTCAFYRCRDCHGPSHTTPIAPGKQHRRGKERSDLDGKGATPHTQVWGEVQNGQSELAGLANMALQKGIGGRAMPCVAKAVQPSCTCKLAAGRDQTQHTAGRAPPPVRLGPVPACRTLIRRTGGRYLQQSQS